MKIMFMLNLAHTPCTKNVITHTPHTDPRRTVSRRVVYESYWNIKFNHGMESINNNFRVRWMKKNDWME